MPDMFGRVDGKRAKRANLLRRPCRRVLNSAQHVEQPRLSSGVACHRE